MMPKLSGHLLQFEHTSLQYRVCYTNKQTYSLAGSFAHMLVLLSLGFRMVSCS